MRLFPFLGQSTPCHDQWMGIHHRLKHECVGETRDNTLKNDSKESIKRKKNKSLPVSFFPKSNAQHTSSPQESSVKKTRRPSFALKPGNHGPSTPFFQGQGQVTVNLRDGSTDGSGDISSKEGLLLNKMSKERAELDVNIYLYVCVWFSCRVT